MSSAQHLTSCLTMPIRLLNKNKSVSWEEKFISKRYILNWNRIIKWILKMIKPRKTPLICVVMLKIRRGPACIMMQQWECLRTYQWHPDHNRKRTKFHIFNLIAKTQRVNKFSKQFKLKTIKLFWIKENKRQNQKKWSKKLSKCQFVVRVMLLSHNQYLTRWHLETKVLPFLFLPTSTMAFR